MIYISHRGNLDGVSLNDENTPGYIQKAINAGYDVEIDVRYIVGEWFLGHDKPEHMVSEEWLQDNAAYLWLHCKNLDAMVRLLEPNIIGQFNSFWHDTDHVVRTVGGFLWTYPGKVLSSNYGIAVCPEQAPGWDISNAVGVCSDYITSYSEAGGG